MKTKKSQRATESVDSLLKSIVKEKFDDQMTERLGGIPSEATQEALNEDEEKQSLDDVDFFDYCHHVFVVGKGKPIIFFIKKDGEYLSTLKPPLSWDALRTKYGAGTYMVQCKSVANGMFLKQQTMSLAEVPQEEALSDTTSTEGFGGFGGQASSGSDIMPIIAMMQQQNERADSQRREDRLADEARRREERETKNDLFKLLIPTLAPVLAVLIAPKDKDNTSTLMLDYIRESSRTAQDQIKDMILRMERMSEKPKDTGPSTMELMKMRDDAYKSGKDDQKEIYDLVEEKAEIRAEELAEKQENGEDSITTTLIKSLGPVLSTVLSQRAAATPQEVTQGFVPTQLEQPLATDAEPQTAAVQVAPPLQENANPEREAVSAIVIPFLVTNLQKMAANVEVDPKAAAKESLQLLKEKGFSQEQVVSLFTKKYLFEIVRSYSLPKALDPWFNDYYAAILDRSAPVPTRLRQRTKPQVVKAGEVARDGGNTGHASGVSADALSDNGGSARAHDRDATQVEAHQLS